MGPLNTVKIENTELVRDMNTQAVLNTDVGGLHRYKEGRRRALSQRTEFQETKKRLETIENELTSLKRIVGELTVLRSRA